MIASRPRIESGSMARCYETETGSFLSSETDRCIDVGMPGNMTKAQALEWLTKHGATVRGYRQEVAAAYLGIGVRRFREDVVAGKLPQPEKHGKRLVWDKIALDRHRDSKVEASQGTHQLHSLDDPIMRSIHAAQSPSLRPGDQV